MEDIGIRAGGVAGALLMGWLGKKVTKKKKLHRFAAPLLALGGAVAGAAATGEGSAVSELASWANLKVALQVGLQDGMAAVLIHGGAKTAQEKTGVNPPSLRGLLKRD